MTIVVCIQSILQIWDQDISGQMSWSGQLLLFAPAALLSLSFCIFVQLHKAVTQLSSKELPQFGPRSSMIPSSTTLRPPWDLQSWHWAWLGASRWIAGTPGGSFGHLYGCGSSAVIFLNMCHWMKSNCFIFPCFHNTTLACAAIAQVSQVHRPRPLRWRDQASYRGQRLAPLSFGGPLALCLQSIGEELGILGEYGELKNPQIWKWSKIERLKSLNHLTCTPGVYKLAVCKL